MQARENLTGRLVPHILNHRIGIWCRRVSIRRERRLRVAQFDASTACDLRGGGQNSAVVGDVVGGGSCCVSVESLAFLVGVGTRIAPRARHPLRLKINERVHAFDATSAAIFHEAHVLELTLVDRLAKIRPVHELIVALPSKKLEQRVRHLAGIRTRFGHDRNARSPSKAQLGGLRCVHGDCCARSEEGRASQADQQMEGYFHVVGRMYIRMVCVEASGIG